jgi:hypothetical protein
MSSYLGAEVRHYSLLTATIMLGRDLSASYLSLPMSSINAEASSFKTDGLLYTYDTILSSSFCSL